MSANLKAQLYQQAHFQRYKTIAKTRATVLGGVSRLIPMPRPLLLVGEQACAELCDIVIAQGCQRAFIVTDAVLHRLGVPQKVTDYLEAHGIRHTVYDAITPDPTFSVIKAGLDKLRLAQCDAVIAIGGGSVIDAAKMIAMCQGNQCSPQRLIGLFKARKPCLPLYAIPSTAGTGSEATIGAVVSDDITHQKAIAIDPKMVPRVAAIDPHILKGMPAHITAETGIDALTHGLEAWMSVNATDETDYYASSAFRIVLKHLPIAYHDADNLLARMEMGKAAHYGGIALNKAGLGYVHAIAHQLGAYYGIPHGRANAIVLPHILAVNRQASAKRLAYLAKKIGLSDAHAKDQRHVVDDLIQQVKQLLVELNISPVIQGMAETHYDDMALAAAKEVSDTYAVPRYLSPAQIKAVLIAIKNASDKATSEAI